MVLLHFLSSPSGSESESSNPYGGDDGWTEALGLNHYADFEAGVKGKVGQGLERVKDRIGVLGGGVLGWGKQGKQLGSLYELIATSNPTPRPAYYDERTSLDRLRLTSSRVLGHNAAGAGGSTDARSTDVDDDKLLFTRSKRHILITGGFGSIGKHLARDLLLSLSSALASPAYDLTPQPDQRAEDILITLFDVEDRSSELNTLLQLAPSHLSVPIVKGTDPRAQEFASQERTFAYFQRLGKVRVVLGDVRDSAAMKGLLVNSPTTIKQDLVEQDSKARMGGKGRIASATMVIPPVSGIVHLASYDPEACRMNPIDCAEVEELGMNNILDALRRDGATTERPWLLMPRRRGGWVLDREAPNLNSSPDSILASQLLVKEFATRHPLHSLLLTLPSTDSIIGDPFSSRSQPIQHIVQSALGDLPIVVHTSSNPSERHDDFLALDDASQSVVQAARMLELAGQKAYLRQLGFVSELEVVGPGLKIPKGAGPVAELAKTVISLVGSLSPFAELLDSTHEADAATESLAFRSRIASRATKRATAKKVLGFTPSTTASTALRTYIQGLLSLQDAQLSKQVSVACSSPPSTQVLEQGLLALSGCTVQLLTIVDDGYFTLGCSVGLEDSHLEPLALVGAVPFKEGVRAVEITAERGATGKVDLQIRCPSVADKDGKPSGPSEIVVWAETAQGGEFALKSAAGDRIVAEWFTTDFVHRDARAFTIVLPPTEGAKDGEEPKRLLVLKDQAGAAKEMIFRAEGTTTKPALWKVNPICCAQQENKKELWDYFKEDPILTSQVTFPALDGRTTLISSTLAYQKCQALRSSHARIEKLQKHLSSPAASRRCDRLRGEANHWEQKERPICQIDCNMPMPCVASSTCRCTRDRCGDRRKLGRFPAVAWSNRTSFAASSSIPSKPPSLEERVGELSWDAIILPGARQAFATRLDDLPLAHVVDVPKTIDTHLLSAACYDLEKSPLPFLGDHFLVEALRNRSTPIQTADFVMTPYYQGCYYNYLQLNTFQKLADTMSFVESRVASVEHIKASSVVVPFTHDFGSCVGWWPRLEEVLGRVPPSPMGQAIAWQVNGDYNTQCVKPDIDVIVPAVSKHSKTLVGLYGKVSSIMPSRQRPHLAFFAGGVRGFGAIARTRLGCGRGKQDAKTTKVLYQQYADKERYLGTLNKAKFCLLPRGIPAWTTRTFEAIYAGCVPVFISDSNLFPFQDILDYSLFSVSVPETQAHQVETLLSRYTEAQVSEMQAHLLKVREAFLFKEGQEWDRQGPLYFSLVSMAMRVYLGYPSVGTCSVAQPV